MGKHLFIFITTILIANLLILSNTWLVCVGLTYIWVSIILTTISTFKKQPTPFVREPLLIYLFSKLCLLTVAVSLSYTGNVITLIAYLIAYFTLPICKPKRNFI